MQRLATILLEHYSLLSACSYFSGLCSTLLFCFVVRLKNAENKIIKGPTKSLKSPKRSTQRDNICAEQRCGILQHIFQGTSHQMLICGVKSDLKKKNIIEANYVFCFYCLAATKFKKLKILFVLFFHTMSSIFCKKYNIF